jgi:uncharacterized protein YyaL (SSP411 family)
MEKESFEDLEVAELINQSFIAIKVDREERLDVDSVYMSVCQALTGSGGWPLTILMTPEQKPFYAGTYFPKQTDSGRIGLMELLHQVQQKWEKGNSKIIHSAQEITDFLNQAQDENNIAATPTKELLRLGVEQLLRSYDASGGGFGGAPRFPVPHNLLFYMKMCQQEEYKIQLSVATHILEQMYRGGIFDHLGGGFSRYSTDALWLVPHFEKMLYDNALLVIAYLEAYQLTKKALFLNVAERTLSYIETELMHSKGGFFCGQDADSEGEEGKFYVFTPDEIVDKLGKAAGEEFCQWFDITKQGNFEGKSIPNLLKNDEFEKQPFDIDNYCKLLCLYRKNRMALHKDDKILTSWNALAIMAFTKAFSVTGKVSYLKIARKAALFARANLMTLNGKLKVRWRDGDVAHDGQLDDYAFYALALLSLYQVDFDVSLLRTALRLTEKMMQWFWDETVGGFFLYGSHVKQLIVRPKELYDGAIPSGNSAAALLLVRLAKIIDEPYWHQAALQQISFLSGNIKKYPAGHTFALLAIHEQLNPGFHVVCATAEDMPTEDLRIFARERNEAVVSLVITEKNQKELIRMIPSLKDIKIPDHGCCYYVCSGEACLPPVNDLGDLELL